MNRHRRGELVTDLQIAVAEIQTGRPLMHNTCVLCAPQLRTWSVDKLIKAVEYRRLYTVVSLPS
ncbi:hypothetical protein [Geobacter sp. SVR]|uniref:hypothetical protein n=1 Tax=Geobacter sp. SVR TaxID=2495594 RepID=UPI00143EF6CC|nr:hypothetical protein [Geobacter sp. SVR]BCS54538.1 hypothetical protein GSVR_28460 [Geobacter sp. SVR]GCF87138.1 hypothetical protein GSbR_37380 [Geobacter sp. SVR]